MVCSFLFFLLFVSSFWPSVILQLVKCNNFSSFLFFFKLNILSVPQQLSSFISLFSTNSLFFPSGFLPYFVSYSSHLRGPFPGSPFLLEEPFLILSLLLGVQLNVSLEHLLSFVSSRFSLFSIFFPFYPPHSSNSPCRSLSLFCCLHPLQSSLILTRFYLRSLDFLPPLLIHFIPFSLSVFSMSGALC